MPPPETLELARRILVFETIEGESLTPTDPVAPLVYQKLRERLSALAGVAGYQALLSRALTLAKAEAPSLRSVQVTADGYVRGLSERMGQWCSLPNYSGWCSSSSAKL